VKGIWPTPEYLAFRQRLRASTRTLSKGPMSALPPAAQDPPPEAKRWHCPVCEIDWIDVRGECWIDAGHEAQPGALVFRNFGSK
jgi:hypothetical protein